MRQHLSAMQLGAIGREKRQSRWAYFYIDSGATSYFVISHDANYLAQNFSYNLNLPGERSLTTYVFR